jgi:methylase of polypeptide subunit release factors
MRIASWRPTSTTAHSGSPSSTRPSTTARTSRHAGSWLTPVEGERFGVVTCSPPYVISPGSGLLYRDGDVRGDVLSELLIRDIPAHLDEGGTAFTIASGTRAYAGARGHVTVRGAATAVPSLDVELDL